jgi:hypothetical protein
MASESYPGKLIFMSNLSWQVVKKVMLHHWTCQQACYKSIANTLIQQLVNMLATSLLRRHPVDKLLKQHYRHNLLTSLLQTYWCKHILSRSCWWYNLLTSLLQTYSIANTSCWQVVETALSQLVNMLATSLLRRHSVDKLLKQLCSHNLLRSLLQSYCKHILLASCWNSIVTTCWQACYKPIANTSCWKVVGTALPQLVNKLATNLLQTHFVEKLLKQHCHNLLTSLLQTYCKRIWLKSCWNSIVTTC